MQAGSATTTMPPDPTTAPAAISASYSTGVPNMLAGMQPPLGPPIWTALAALPSRHPPPTVLMSSSSDNPNGTSTSPLCVTLPVSAKTFVPRLLPVPIAEYFSAPWAMIHPTLARVSTLLMQVGLPQSPEVVGKGGLGRGMPRLPSTEVISAVSSPQTNAPAPSRMCTVNENSEPSSFSPRYPAAVASLIALRRRLTASGYSART